VFLSGNNQKKRLESMKISAENTKNFGNFSFFLKENFLDEYENRFRKKA
jgi:hypothetical protein